jgi:endonuclease/exonuclease/phosphatase family metal-dependent hydrolase
LLIYSATVSLTSDRQSLPSVTIWTVIAPETSKPFLTLMDALSHDCCDKPEELIEHQRGGFMNDPERAIDETPNHGSGRERDADPVADNDTISELFEIALPNGLVRDDLQGTNRFLDIVTWNIKFFDLKSAERVRQIGRILNEIAADVMVFQEIDEAAMLPVASFLNDIGAGAYQVEQGTTGGNQRVTVMYDTEWVRTTATPRELFAGSTIEGKDVFPRLPVSLQFVAKASDNQGLRYEFNLIGVHLKSQRGPNRSVLQRTAAAKTLAEWLTDDSQRDEDILIVGDWNAEPDREEWKVLRELEAQGAIHFDSFNRDPITGQAEGSHLSKSGHSSRLDLVVITDSALADAAMNHAQVIRWEQVLDTKKNLARVIDTISDHLPVISRFYFEPPRP